MSGDNPVQPQNVQLIQMTLEDVPEVISLEKMCFLRDPWPAEVYIENLCCIQESFYWIVRPGGSNPISGIPQILATGGYHLEETNSHIMTLATHLNWRRRKIGEWLLLNMLKLSREAGAKRAYLEVREDNIAAVRMYLKLGFLHVRQLDHYYRSDSGKAYLLALNNLDRAIVWQPLLKALDSIVIDLS